MALELVNDVLDFESARMNVAILECFSGVPVSAEKTVDLKLFAFVLNMLFNLFQGLDLDSTRKALNFEASAFVFDVLLEVL